MSFAKIRPKFEKNYAPIEYRNTIIIRTRLRKSNDGLSARPCDLCFEFEAELLCNERPLANRFEAELLCNERPLAKCLVIASHLNVFSQSDYITELLP